MHVSGVRGYVLCMRREPLLLLIVCAHKFPHHLRRCRLARHRERRREHCDFLLERNGLRVRTSSLCEILQHLATRGLDAQRNFNSAVQEVGNLHTATKYRGADSPEQKQGTAGSLSFGPMAQCVVHALKGLACSARVTPASSPASHCKQCSALTSPALHARGCARPSRAR